MIQLKQTSLALVSAGLLALGLSSTAQAGALATSVLQISNFVISKSTGVAFDVSDFDTATFTSSSSADISASYNGAIPSGSGDASPTGQINLPAVCQGPGCGGVNSILADNTFPIISTVAGAFPGGAPNANYAAADQNESGAPITGLIPGPVGATVQSASYVSLLGNGLGSSSANNQLSVDFKFSLATAQSLTFSFTGLLYQEAYLTPGETVPSFAQASNDFSFSIVDENGNSVFDWSPNAACTGCVGTVTAPFDMDTARSRTAPNTGVQFAGSALGVASSGLFSATTGLLQAGVLYTLDGKLKTTADAARIPEPGVLALLGMGLIGMGLTRRRKTV